MFLLKRKIRFWQGIKKWSYLKSEKVTGWCSGCKRFQFTTSYPGSVHLSLVGHSESQEENYSLEWVETDPHYFFCFEFHWYLSNHSKVSMTLLSCLQSFVIQERGKPQVWPKHCLWCLPKLTKIMVISQIEGFCPIINSMRNMRIAIGILINIYYVAPISKVDDSEEKLHWYFLSV